MRASYRILFNTLFLYANMVVTMLISILATRWLLEALGEQDMGVYSLIAGIVAMLSFINVALTAASQRFLSFAMGEGQLTKIKEVFYSSVVMHLALAVFIFLLIQIGGSLLVQYVLNIPPHLVYSAQIVLCCMAFSCSSTVATVPYDAAINAHEDMGVIALINILEAALKGAAAYMLFFLKDERLIIYGIAIAVICINSLVIKRYYCSRYEECHFKWQRIKDKTTLREMAGFASWNLIGTGCNVGRNQGIAVLLNVFFNVAMNTAYGIAQQVNGMLSFFSATIVRAVRPQVMKSEGANNRTRMLRLSLTTCKATFLLLAIGVTPLFAKMDFILDIWLKTPPAHTFMFCQYYLIITLLYQLTIGLQMAIESTGRIKYLQIFVGSLHIAALPMGYVCLKLGMPVDSVMACMVIEEGVALVTRTIIAHKQVNLNAMRFITKLVVPCTLVAAVSIVVCNTLCSMLSWNGWVELFVAGGMGMFLISLGGYYLCFNAEEQKFVGSIAAGLKKKMTHA